MSITKKSFMEVTAKQDAMYVYLICASWHLVSKRSNHGKERKLTLYSRITHCIAPRFFLFWIHWLHSSINVISNEHIYDNHHHVKWWNPPNDRHHAHSILVLILKDANISACAATFVTHMVIHRLRSLLSSRNVCYFCQKATIQGWHVTALKGSFRPESNRLAIHSSKPKVK